MTEARNIPTILTRIRQWARAIKRDVHALWLAARDSRTPWLCEAARLGYCCLCIVSDRPDSGLHPRAGLPG